MVKISARGRLRRAIARERLRRAITKGRIRLGERIKAGLPRPRFGRGRRIIESKLKRGIRIAPRKPDARVVRITRRIAPPGRAISLAARTKVTPGRIVSRRARARTITARSISVRRPTPPRPPIPPTRKGTKVKPRPKIDIEAFKRGVEVTGFGRRRTRPPKVTKRKRPRLTRAGFFGFFGRFRRRRKKSNGT